MHRSKILHRELEAELIDDVLEKRRSRSSKYNVIDVQEKVRDIGSAAQHKQGAVGLGGDEAEVL